MTRPTAMAPDASTSPVEWGPEIRVHGKRPEWLADDQVIAYHDGHGWYGDSPCFTWTAHMVGHQQKVLPGDFDDWPNATAIRLPADHPYYRQPTTPELDPALWDRMVALVRDMSKLDMHHAPVAAPYIYQATKIVADLPKPVDPDLIEARRIACESSNWPRDGEHWLRVKQGKEDHIPMVRTALAAIKRGRELAGEQA